MKETIVSKRLRIWRFKRGQWRLRRETEYKEPFLARWARNWRFTLHEISKTNISVEYGGATFHFCGPHYNAERSLDRFLSYIRENDDE